MGFLEFHTQVRPVSPHSVGGSSLDCPLASSAGRPALKATQESPGHVVQTLPPDTPSTWFTSHLGGEEAGSRLDCPAKESPPHGNLKPGEWRFLLRLQLNVPLE